MDAILDDICDLKAENNRLNNVLLVKITKALNSGIKNKDLAGLNELLKQLENTYFTAEHLVKAVIDKLSIELDH
ncbi:hypothetical protein [Dasania marina]|uniref:hypothetical protein n=1 Tax=Dasania marina TaxID=471499 RepID=UPI0030DDDA3D